MSTSSDTIPDNATSIVRSCSKTVHKLMWHDYKLQEANRRSFCAFIINNVEDTWIRKLLYTETVYNNVTTKIFMDLLQMCCWGLHALKVVDLTSKMINYYGDAVGAPKYINMIEDVKKNSQRAQTPVLDVTIVAIVTKSIFQSQAFISEMKEW